MQKAFHFDSAPDPYIADAAVLCCFDQRIRLVVNKFLQRQKILRPDMIVVAGGAKTLASPRNDFERDFILEQVRMSILLHKTATGFSDEPFRLRDLWRTGGLRQRPRARSQSPQGRTAACRSVDQGKIPGDRSASVSS